MMMDKYVIPVMVGFVVVIGPIIYMVLYICVSMWLAKLLCSYVAGFSIPIVVAIIFYYIGKYALRRS